MMRIERGYWDTVPDELEKKRGITFEDALDIETKNYPECKREAITKALWVILAGEETLMSKECIIDLYKSWGMQNAESAAQQTFRSADLDHRGSLDYHQFKKAFHVMIDGIFLVGEFQDVHRENEKLVKKETP